MKLNNPLSDNVLKMFHKCEKDYSKAHKASFVTYWANGKKFTRKLGG